MRTFMLAVLFLAGCKGNSDVPATANLHSIPDGRTPSALVAALDSATLASMEMRRGDWKDADASSTWRAWVDHGKVRAIEEFMSVGDYSARRLMHYYTNDEKLAAQKETRDQLVLMGDRPPARELVVMTMEFSGGSATQSAKTVNGVSKSVEPFEIETARKHGELLLMAARNAAASNTLKP